MAGKGWPLATERQEQQKDAPPVDVSALSQSELNKAAEIAELIKHREFQTTQDLFKAIQKGGTFYEVPVTEGLPDGVKKIEILSAGRCEDYEADIAQFGNKHYYGKTVFYVWDRDSDRLVVGDTIDSLQEHPAQGIFSTEETAIKYLNEAASVYGRCGKHLRLDSAHI